LEKTINVLVKPGSKKQSIKKSDLEEGLLEIKLISKPVKGEANKELKEVLSQFFGVPKNYIDILKGEHSKKKLIKVMLYKKY
jgi:uncharacterized protein (TIGR00251 family)